jgi:type III secretory pathway component EscU
MYIPSSKRELIMSDFVAAVVTTILAIMKDKKAEFPGFPEVTVTAKDETYYVVFSIAGTTSRPLSVGDEIITTQVELFQKNEPVTQEFFNAVAELVNDLSWWLMSDNLIVGGQPSKYRNKTTLTI